MATCKRCESPIRWQKNGASFVALNLDGAPHQPTCQGAVTCRFCEKQIVWIEHEGKSHPFELDGTTLHNDVCIKKDQCPHCDQKIRWALVDEKWVIFDRKLSDVLHWSLCPKNPAAAKVLIQKLELLAQEVEGLRKQVVLTTANPNEVITDLRKQVTKAHGALREREAYYARELKYRDVELARITKKAEAYEAKMARER